jgi:hypothetical protein
MAAMGLGAARDRLYARLEEEAAELVDAGAETIVPAGGLPSVAFPDVIVRGRRFLNIIAAAARATRTQSPHAGPPPPPEAVQEFLYATGGDLSPPVGSSADDSL